MALATSKVEWSLAKQVDRFLTKIYLFKFSFHVPLSIILLSGLYTVYRTTHYLKNVFKVDYWLGGPTSIFIEMLVVGSGAMVYLAWSRAYAAEQAKQDVEIARVSAWIATVIMLFAFISLLTVAWGDAWYVTNDYLPSFLMSFVQITQSGMIIMFVLLELLDDREETRAQFANAANSSCKYCGRTVTPNNRRKHEGVCPLNPANNP